MTTRRIPAASRAAAVLLVLVGGGCTVGPEYVRPAPPAPNAFGSVGQTVPGAPPPTEWWRGFGSARLNAAVDQARAANADLEIARARLIQAREAAVRAGAARYPAVAFSASVIDTTSSLLPEGVNVIGPAVSEYSIGPTVSFDLDVFGGGRRLRQARGAEAEAAAFESEAARIAVSADVVRAALEAAHLRARLDILGALSADDRRTAASVEILVQAGRKTVADLEAARSQAAADESLVPATRQALAAVDVQIVLLMGETPGEAGAAEFRLTEFTDPRPPPAVLPADLVRGRPDVRAAEARLRAANAKIGVAVAHQYPDLTLVGLISQETLEPGMLFSSAATASILGAGVVVPVFQGGALRSDVRSAKAAYQESAALYRRTVLAAVGQVSTTLQALKHDEEGETADAAAVSASERALAAAEARYAVSRADLVEVSSARRALGRARLAASDARVRRLLDLTALYAAVGGAGA